MYKIIADLHTHSIASTHAHSTIYEMIKSAKNKGLYAISITDHGAEMPGNSKVFYFESLNTLPLIQEGVKFISGIEANILDFDGTIDYEPHCALNFVIASAHGLPNIKGLRNPTIEKCTKMYMNLAKNEYVNAIGHSGTEYFKYDYEKVIKEFKTYGKLVEINSRSFFARKGGAENCRQIALLCKKYDVNIIVSSDAHYHTEVADFKHALDMLEEIDFPEKLIINGDEQRLDEYLNKFTNINTSRKF